MAPHILAQLRLPIWTYTSRRDNKTVKGGSGDVASYIAAAMSRRCAVHRLEVCKANMSPQLDIVH